MATEPPFEMQEIGSGLTDGYWIQAVDVNGDGHPNTLRSGLSDGSVSSYRNPHWQKDASAAFLYKFSDVRGGTFEKTGLSDTSAARISIADFDGDGRLDFPALGYYVPGSSLCEDPQLALLPNRNGTSIPGAPVIPARPLGE